MKRIKLFDAELMMMHYLWENGSVQAAHIAEEFFTKHDWKKSTTYIVLKRLEGKGVLRRVEPKYQVVPLVTREQVQLGETNTLLDRMFNGSFTSMVANYLASDEVSDSMLDELQAIIAEKKKQNS